MQSRFVLFGAEHLVTLSIIFSASILIPLIIYAVNNKMVIRNISYIFAFLLITHELVKPFYRFYFYGDPLLQIIPIHICHVAAISMGLFFIYRIQFFFEIAFFWGFTGNLAAMLTPDLALGFPDARFITYYFSHALLLTAVMFACINLSTNLKWITVLKIFIVTLIAMPIIYIINILLIRYDEGVNYWYLMKSPDVGTILSFFPNPPMHIPYLIVAGALLFALTFLPYYLIKKSNKRKFQSSYNF